MSEEYEDDPAISAIYRKAGDLAPPSSLDNAILTAAKRAAWRRRQRWVLPFSTAAVVVLSVALLMNMSDEWNFSRDKAGDTPVPQTPSSVPGPVMVKKKKSSLPAAPQELAVEEDPHSNAPTALSVAKPSPTPSASTIANAREAAPIPGSISTEAVTAAQPAAEPSKELSRHAARSKAESTGILAFSDNTYSKLETQDKETTRKSAEAATPHPEPETKLQEETGVQRKVHRERIELKPLEPKPWIEKIRKLVSAGKKGAALKELEAFKKRYPTYKLPDDMKSLN